MAAILPVGDTAGDLFYWDGNVWVIVPAADVDQYLSPQLQGDGTVAYDYPRLRGDA